jgi:putative ABC transport system substrate-binding protein
MDKMTRLTLSLALAIALLLLPVNYALSADKTIGVIMTGDIPYYKEIHNAFSQGISGTGGLNIVVQKPAPEPMSWTNAARKLVAIGSDVIVSYGAPATLTAIKETSSIPIIFAGVYDPEAMEIMRKNVTGISSKVSVEDAVNQLKAVVSVSTLGVVFNKTEKDTILQVREVKVLGGKMGFKTVLFDSKKSNFAQKIKGVDAILLTTSCTAVCNVTQIIRAARAARIPTASTIGGVESHGIIFTIEADPREQGAAVAAMSKKVLNGAAPSSIPVQQPRKIEKIINLKEASALGINMPDSVTGWATKTIK